MKEGAVLKGVDGGEEEIGAGMGGGAVVVEEDGGGGVVQAEFGDEGEAVDFQVG